MNIGAVTRLESGGSATADSASLTMGPDDFLILLIAELQNQDPLSPMDTDAFFGQLSQMQLVSETRALRQSQQFSQAIALIGHDVQWQDPVNGSYSWGAVDGVIAEGSDPVILVGNVALKLEQILAIREVADPANGSSSGPASRGSAS